METSRKERLLLVRVPAFVAEHWLKVAPECDAPLGVVQPQGAMAAGNNGGPAAAGRQRYSVRLDKHAAYPASYPHEFELTCAAPAEPLYAFSRPIGKSGTRTRLEGRVALRGDVKPPPQLTKEYVQILRDRRAKYSDTSKRAIGVLDSVESEAHVKLKAKDARVGDKEAKREARLDRGPKVVQYDDDKPEDALKISSSTSSASVLTGARRSSRRSRGSGHRTWAARSTRSAITSRWARIRAITN